MLIFQVIFILGKSLYKLCYNLDYMYDVHTRFFHVVATTFKVARYSNGHK